MTKQKILFVCIRNSARSVMAEAFVNQLCREHYEAQSAGIEPGELNPIVTTVMAEIGIDVSGHQPRAVAGVIKKGQQFAYVITLCNETSAERCPIIPGAATHLHWGFPDPSVLPGTQEEKTAATRVIRDHIKEQVETFCISVCQPSGSVVERAAMK